MKIIYLSTARLPDEWAHGVQIMKMCEAVVLAGHRVELVVPRRAKTIKMDPFVYYGIKKNFRLTKLPSIDIFAGSQSRLLYFIRTFSFLICARVYLMFKRYDVLYTREYSFLPYLPISKTVLELHSIPQRKYFWDIAKKLSRLVAITQGIKEDLVKHAVEAGRVLVAPDAVDLNEFVHPQTQEAARRRLGLPADMSLALYIGRLDAWKGIDGLYDASELLSPSVRIAVIGGEKEEVASLSKQYPKIMFLGFRPYRELADNQAAADVLLLPNTAKNEMSARYTSPLKLFTYMASGKPIVASDLPSIREILDERTAVLVKPDDPKALAEGIEKVLADTANASRLAANARTKVEEYTWSNRARRIMDYVRG